MDELTQTELEAAAFRRLVAHLRERSDVQNIDLMNLAGFCRNCLSRWYREAAEERNLPLTDAQAREFVYGMPYDVWKAQHQIEATPGAKDGIRRKPEDVTGSAIGEKFVSVFIRHSRAGGIHRCLR